MKVERVYYLRRLFGAVTGAVVLSVSCAASAQSYTVVGVTDGDTVKVLSADYREMKCRLWGIDAPESRQAMGTRSKQSLSDLVYRKVVHVQVVDRDRYGRSVCRIYLDGVDVNKEQIARGMAWMYRRYAKDAGYSAAEAAAKSAGVGLWQDPAPVAPWDFRRSK